MKSSRGNARSWRQIRRRVFGRFEFGGVFCPDGNMAVNFTDVSTAIPAARGNQITEIEEI